MPKKLKAVSANDVEVDRLLRREIRDAMNIFMYSSELANCESACHHAHEMLRELRNAINRELRKTSDRPWCLEYASRFSNKKNPRLTVLVD